MSWKGGKQNEESKFGVNTLRFHSALECPCLKDTKQCKMKIFVKRAIKDSFFVISV